MGALLGQIVHDHGGDVVKFTGDGMLVLWPYSKAQPASGQADQLQRLTEYVAHLEQTVA